jgi:dihydroneopterin aldolase
MQDLIKQREEIVSKAHIEWLSKAYTCKCDSEKTAISYGFLGQAVKEALEEYHDLVIDEVIKEIEDILEKDKWENNGTRLDYRIEKLINKLKTSK